MGERRWAAVDGFIHRHGGKAVLLGRLTALMRALMPSMAGMSGMRYRTFLLWNAVGGVFWAPGCVLLGYAFASALDVVGETLTWAPLAIVAVDRRGHGRPAPAQASAPRRSRPRSTPEADAASEL